MIFQEILCYFRNTAKFICQIHSHFELVTVVDLKENTRKNKRHAAPFVRKKLHYLPLQIYFLFDGLTLCQTIYPTHVYAKATARILNIFKQCFKFSNVFAML